MRAAMDLVGAFLPEIRLPERAFVDRARDRDEQLPDEVEEEPRSDEACGELERRPERELAPRLCFRRAGELCEAIGAEDPTLVLGDALTAKSARAFRAAPDGFARGMIEATLRGDYAHGVTAGVVSGAGA